jgi:hypothetical protein
MMIDYHVDLSQFPPLTHRIVKSWYSWQEIYLRKIASYPGKDKREPRGHETAEEIFWGGPPPAITNDGDLRFLDDGELSYYLISANDGYCIDKTSRGSRGRYWMFRRFEDAEKYMVFLISQLARPGYYEESPSFRWYKEGLDPRVTLVESDPTDSPGLVTLTVDQESIDRGRMSEHNAIAASHVLILSFEELDAVLREGIPPDWFSVKVVSD